jgi:signal transduction histidine kinase
MIRLVTPAFFVAVLRALGLRMTESTLPDASTVHRNGNRHGPAGDARAGFPAERTEPLRRADEGRALTAAAEERRRIANDLHDGAQQRLVVLEIGLEAVAQLVDDDPAAAVKMIRRLANEAHEALNEMRRLVRGIQPPELTDFGLVSALREVTRLSAMPIRVSTHDVGRYHEAIEDAVYFACREAIQNVLKHAPDATTVTLRVADENGHLEFEVRDDGPGLVDDAHQRGSGIASMRHRIASLGGRLTVTSAPAGGTLVRGRLPVDGAVIAG